MDSFQRRGTFFVADLYVPLIQNLENDVIPLRVLAKGLVQVFCRCGLSLGDVQEDIWNLEDVVYVGLYALAPLEDFVLVLFSRADE